MSDTFGQVLRRWRTAAGRSQPQLARQIHVDQSVISRWETGRTTPDPDTARRLDHVLATGGELAPLLAPHGGSTPPCPGDEPVTGEYVQFLHETITQLVTLDGQHGGAELVPLAARTYRSASTRLAAGHYSPRLESDFASAVAELGEVAGWLAFDATQYDRARWFNQEALHQARLAGDQSMELFLLGNMAMQAQELGQARDALRTVQRMEQFPLSPRLQVMVALRRARAAADLGDHRALPLIRRAQAQVDASVHTSDPEWAWWVDHRELRVHEGGMWRAIGWPDRAVDCYADALEAVPRRYRWASYVGGANFVAALVDVRSWHEAETALDHVAALAPEVSSGRATQRLREAATMARRRHAPSSIDDKLAALCA